MSNINIRAMKDMVSLVIKRSIDCCLGEYNRTVSRMLPHLQEFSCEREQQ